MKPETITVFDTETTGVRVFEDRILTCYMASYNRDMSVNWEQSWVINPGVEIPEEAAKVHGMTTEWIRKNGRDDVEECIGEIVDSIFTEVTLKGNILGGYNISYDLSILNYEAERVDYPLLQLGRAIIIDPLILDRAKDKYRTGGRKLMDVARHYGIEVDDTQLHRADYDVFITAQLVWKFLDMWNAPLSGIVSYQQKAKLEWAKNFEKFLFNKGERNPKVNGEFPIQTEREGEE